MRATLHDELMREAGFESDYDLERARRRERRRVDFLHATRVATVVGLVAGGVVVFTGTDGKTSRLPWAVVLVLGVLTITGGLAQLLQSRMTRDESDPGLWKRVTRPWRNDAR